MGFGYSFLKKIGSGQDQDIGLISKTKFSWKWFKMSQVMVAAFFSLWFLYCQYVLHSSQSMVIRVTLSLIFSGQVEVVSCSYIAVCCFVCCAEWHMCVNSLFHGCPTCLRLGSTRRFLDNSRSTSR